MYMCVWCSCHKESLRAQPVSVGELVVKRLEASQRLQENPGDVVAQQVLAYVEHQVNQYF